MFFRSSLGCFFFKVNESAIMAMEMEESLVVDFFFFFNNFGKYFFASPAIKEVLKKLIRHKKSYRKTLICHKRVLLLSMDRHS